MNKEGHYFFLPPHASVVVDMSRSCKELRRETVLRGRRTGDHFLEQQAEERIREMHAMLRAAEAPPEGAEEDEEDQPAGGVMAEFMVAPGDLVPMGDMGVMPPALSTVAVPSVVPPARFLMLFVHDTTTLRAAVMSTDGGFRRYPSGSVFELPVASSWVDTMAYHETAGGFEICSAFFDHGVPEGTIQFFFGVDADDRVFHAGRRLLPPYDGGRVVGSMRIADPATGAPLPQVQVFFSLHDAETVIAPAPGMLKMRMMRTPLQGTVPLGDDLPKVTVRLPLAFTGTVLAGSLDQSHMLIAERAAQSRVIIVSLASQGDAAVIAYALAYPPNQIVQLASGLAACAVTRHPEFANATVLTVVLAGSPHSLHYVVVRTRVPQAGRLVVAGGFVYMFALVRYGPMHTAVGMWIVSMQQILNHIATMPAGEVRANRALVPVYEHVPPAETHGFPAEHVAQFAVQRIN